jgi:hypothetical protein
LAVPAWVSEVGIAAQVFIAVVAVYGEKIRSRVAKPRLRIALAEGAGVPEPRRIGRSTKTVTYHRLHVGNTARYSVATEVQVFITKIERREPTGQMHTEFIGMAPLAWQHQPPAANTRNVGSSTVAAVDLLYLTSDTLHLTPLDPAPESLGVGALAGKHFWVTLVARGLNAESPPVRLELDWSGTTQNFSISLVQ